MEIKIPARKPSLKHTGAGHLRIATIREFRRVRVKEAIRDLKPHSKLFTTIVVSGYSSTIMGSIIADKLYKNLVIVRKPKTEAKFDHRSSDVEGVHGQDCIFIDDLICTGETIKRVKQGIESCGGKLIGFWLYHNLSPSSTIDDDIIVSLNGTQAGMHHLFF